MRFYSYILSPNLHLLNLFAFAECDIKAETFDSLKSAANAIGCEIVAISYLPAQHKLQFNNYNLVIEQTLNHKLYS